MPALPRLVGLNGRSPSQARKSPVCPLYSWIRCGARSRNLRCMRVVHRSGGSSTWESAESTWLTIRSFLSFSGSPLWLCRQLVAVWGRWHLEGVHDTAEDPVIVRRRRQLDQPLYAVPVLEGIEGCLVDMVVADKLRGVGDDLALFDGQSGRIFPGPDHVDSLLAHPGAAGRIHLGRPHVCPLPLPHTNEDGE